MGCSSDGSFQSFSCPARMDRLLLGNTIRDINQRQVLQRPTLSDLLTNRRKQPFLVGNADCYPWKGWRRKDL